MADSGFVVNLGKSEYGFLNQEGASDDWSSIKENF